MAEQGRTHGDPGPTLRTLRKDRAGAVLEAFRRRGEPDGLLAARRAGLEAFLAAGLPGPADESWRGTDLRAAGVADIPLLPPEEGACPAPRMCVVGSPYEACTRGEGVEFCDILEALLREEGLRPLLFPEPAARGERAPLADLNAGLTAGGGFLRVHAGASPEGILRVDVPACPGCGPGRACFPRTVVILEPRSRARVIERLGLPGGGDAGFAASVTEVFVGPEAELEILTLSGWGEGTPSCHRGVARVAEGGRVRWLAGTTGGRLARMELEVRLEGPGAEGIIAGAAVGDGERRLDHRTVQVHAAPDTTSRIYFGTLLRERSRSRYRGLIRIAEEAVRSDAYQKNDNLLLEPGAAAHAAPMLEILNEAVRCTHGCTVGRVRPEDLFYLESRGLERNRARAIVAEGFLRRQVTAAGEPSPLTRVLVEVLLHRALRIGTEGDRPDAAAAAAGVAAGGVA